MYYVTLWLRVKCNCSLETTSPVPVTLDDGIKFDVGAFATTYLTAVVRERSMQVLFLWSYFHVIEQTRSY